MSLARVRLLNKYVIALAICVAGGLNMAATASTCVGANPCNACHNCSACKRCSKLGLTCGVCKNGNRAHVHVQPNVKLASKSK